MSLGLHPDDEQDAVEAHGFSWLGRLSGLVPAIIATMGVLVLADVLRDALAGGANLPDVALDASVVLLCAPAYALARWTLVRSRTQEHALGAPPAPTRAASGWWRRVERPGAGRPPPKPGGPERFELDAAGLHIDLLRADLYQLLDQLARSGDQERAAVLLRYEYAWARFKEATSARP